MVDPGDPLDPPAALGELEHLAHEAANRALDQQAGVLNELRARTATLIAVAALTASFLGSQAVASEGVGTLGALALLAFVVSVLAAIYILLPKPDLVFALEAPVLYEQLFEFRDRPSELHRRLAYWTAGYRGENAPKIDKLFQCYRISAVALIVETLLWAIQLRGTL